MEGVGNTGNFFKEYKALGDDSLPVETYTASSALVECLTNLLGKLWDAEYVLQDGRNATTVPIFKKGDERESKNYPGVSLIDTAF